MRVASVFIFLLHHFSIPVDSQSWIESTDESLDQHEDLSEEESLKNRVVSRKTDTFSSSGTVWFNEDSKNSSDVSQLHDSKSLNAWARRLDENRQVKKQRTPKPSTRKPTKSLKTPSPTRRTSKPTIASSEDGRCPVVPTKGCSICGTNRCVTKPESVFSFPNQPSVQCGILEQGGLDGLVNQDICAALPEYVSDICGCLDLTQNNLPPPSCPSIPSNGCSVCGTDKCVSKPNEIFSFPNQPDLSCGLLQQGGLDGRISSNTCVQISELIQDVCGCTTPKPVSVTITSCPKVSSSGCSVCGTNKCITKPQNIFSFPNQPDIKCDLLQQGGLDGRISSDTCVQISELIQDACGCTTPKPVPILISSCPKVPSNGCSVCGTNKCITKQQNIFSFPNQPDIKCDLLQQGGLDGRISSDTCLQISELIQDVCGCSEPIPLPTPTKTCPTVPPQGCSICGPGKCISTSNIFNLPGQPAISCPDLQQAGLNGVLDATDCALLPSLVDKPCGCITSGGLKPSTSPSSQSPFPTSGRPSRPPTLFLTPPPTTGRPTLLPTSSSSLKTSPPTPSPILSVTPLPTNKPFTIGPTILPTPLPTKSPSTLSPTTSTTPPPTKAPSIPPTTLITPPPTAVATTQSPTSSTTSIPTSGITSPPSTIAPVTTSGTPSPAVTPAPTSSMSSIACSPFQFQDGACSVCGSGMCVGLPNEIFAYPGQPSVLCGDLELAGYDGQIPLSLCPFLPSIIATTCGCRG